MTATFSELQKFVTLDQLVSEKKTPDIVAPVFPGLGCGFFAVSFIAPLIEKSAAIMIAPAICAHNARVFMSRFEQSSFMLKNNLVFFLYEDDDIIHGAEETIKNAIVDFYHKQKPEVIFVVTSCLPEIVGEDIEAVVRQVRDVVKIPVLFIRTENFTNISSKQGMERALEALIELMDYPVQKIPHSVNIIGASAFRSFNTELFTVISKTGYSIHSVIPSHTDLDTLQKAPEASCNIILDRGAIPLAEKMKEKYQMDYFLFDRPFSPESILHLYRNLGMFLSVDIESIITPEYNSLLQLTSVLKQGLAGKKAIISIGQGRTFDLAFLLHSFGIKIAAIAIDEIFEQDYADAKKFHSDGGKSDIIRNASCYPLEEYLVRIKPDYYITFSGYEENMCKENHIGYRNIHSIAFLNGFDFAIHILLEIFGDYVQTIPNFDISAMKMRANA